VKEGRSGQEETAEKGKRQDQGRRHRQKRKGWKRKKKPTNSPTGKVWTCFRSPPSVISGVRRTLAEKRREHRGRKAPANGNRNGLDNKKT